MDILLVTDAWEPQVNGVVRTLGQTRDHLAASGHRVDVLSPADMPTWPCPGYREIRLGLRPFAAAGRRLDDHHYDAVHIATEGPLGLAARRWCIRHGREFTTSYHTRFPEYLRLRAPVPLAWSYGLLRRFHAPATRTLVRTATQQRLLAERGFGHLAVWPGAVDTRLFRPRDKCAPDLLPARLPRPLAMYVGRVSPEKNLEAWLNLDLPGSKVVVGGGPALASLRRRHPEVLFTGYRHGEDLARTLAAADVFMFPSRTDTLGLVMLEAMACGVPVAAFPVPGPADLVIDGGNGALDEDLTEAFFRALAVPAEACVEYAAGFSWERSTRRFAALLARAEPGEGYNSGPCPSTRPAPTPASTSPAN